MLSLRSAGPYVPDMPMAPRPSADTAGPAAPHWRPCISFPGAAVGCVLSIVRRAAAAAQAAPRDFPDLRRAGEGPAEEPPLRQAPGPPCPPAVGPATWRYCS